MDPWIGENEDYVKEIVRSITSNDGTQHKRELEIDYASDLSDEEWEVVMKAIKRNESLENFSIDFDESGDQQLLATRALLLSDAIQNHATLKKLRFYSARHLRFDSIEIAIKNNPELSRISFDRCHISRDVVECLAFVMKENALESLVINQGTDENGYYIPIDITGVLGRNQSIREFVLTDDSSNDPTMTAATLREVIRMLSANQGLKRLELHLDGLENPSDVISDIASTGTGHRSLEKLALPWSGECNVNMPQRISVRCWKTHRRCRNWT